jgi:hypothetical protein
MINANTALSSGSLSPGRNFRVLLLLLLHLAAGLLPAAEFHVSPDGHDAGTGSPDRPFATLERARDAIRLLPRAADGRAAEGATVLLRGGTYPRKNTFLLTGEDSGTAESPVVYRAHPGERVVLTGAAEIPRGSFSPVTDPQILARLPAGARGKVWAADLRRLGIHEYGTLALFGASVLPPYTVGPVAAELFVAGKAMNLARWPDTEYAVVETVVEMGSILRNWMPDMVGRNDRRARYVPPAEREDPPRGFAFTVAGDRATRWSTAEDAWLYGYWYWDWSDQSVRIASIDTATRVIRTAHASGYGVRSGQRFFVFNLLEELDSPGEWYLDRGAGLLYLYPTSPDNLTPAHLTLATDPLVRLQDVSHVTLQGLTLGLTRGDGVHVAGGEGVVVDRCAVGQLGGKAIVVRGGSRHTVQGCLVHDTGADGIHLTGGDRPSLTPGGHAVLHNEITRFSRRQKTYSPGVTVSGVGHRVAHNLIHEAPHAAVHFEGNDHTIEFNEIHRVLLESDDAGAIYSGRRFTYWGNRIRHNYIHHVEGLPPDKVRFRKGVLAHAVYLDDQLAGVEVAGNVFVRCNDATVIKGSDNRFENNVVIDCRRAVWDMSKEPPATHPEPLRFDDPKRLPQHLDPTVLADILSVPYSSARWREKYPALATSLEQTRGPWRVSIARNVLCRTPELEVSEGMKRHGRVADNHRLADDEAPVERAALGAWLAKLPARFPGFAPIPFERIGPHGPVGPP